MNQLRSIADQLRTQIATPDDPDLKIGKKKNVNVKPKISKAKVECAQKILDEILAYDNSNHKHMVHVRFDATTAQLLNHFKMATNVDVTKLVAFSVKYLFKNHPELKLIIKQFIQNLEL